MREIERKFLISDDSFLSCATSHRRIAQGYLCHKRVTARVRIYGDEAFITFKGKSRDGGLSRFEFERQIPMRCAELLLERCDGKIEKIRYLVDYKGYTWEVDIDQQPELPQWIWKEVTSDYHYRNSYLAKKPYKSWFE